MTIADLKIKELRIWDFGFGKAWGMEHRARGKRCGDAEKTARRRLEVRRHPSSPYGLRRDKEVGGQRTEIILWERLSAAIWITVSTIYSLLLTADYWLPDSVFF